jgi:hypothetical protein
MEGLAGDLGTMPIPDLLLYLANKTLTGTLVCERGTVKKSIIVKAGDVTNAASSDPREHLGQFLINFGHITEDQLTKAFHTQAETKIFLGRILVMIGAVNEETLKSVLTIKARETTLGLCRWKDGSFRFARGVLPAEQDGVSIAVPLLDIHREAEFRETVWEAMLQVFPSMDLALQLDESKAPKNLAPGSLDAQLFDLIREGHTIEELCLRLHASDFHLYQRLYALYRQGVIFPTAPMPKVDASPVTDDAIGEEMGVAEILKHARAFLASKSFSDAEALASRAVEMRSNTENLSVLKEAETGLLDQLRHELMTGTKVPRLSSPDIKLKSLALSPQEKYLMSRIDGSRDIKAIIRVSPVRELDALKYFKRFLESGYITL